MADVQGEPSLEELMEAIRQLKVSDFLLSAVSTLASIGYGKLDSGELVEAKTAIDAIAALLPLLDGGVRRDLGQALAHLQLAYASAAPPASSEATE